MPPTTLQHALALGVEHLQAGRLPQAEAVFRDILAQFPQNADAWFLLGNTLTALGQNTPAVNAYQQAANLRPDNPATFFNLGNVLRAQGRPADAEQSYLRALQLQPDMFQAHANLGALYESLGRYQEALAHYQQALPLAPPHPVLHYNMGVALAALGRFQDAIAAYRKSIQLKPDYFEAHNNLANALQALGRLDEAVAACRQALHLKPDLAEALANLGTILGDLARHDEGLVVLRQALAFRPDDSRFHSNFVFALAYHPQIDAPSIRRELALFDQRHVLPFRSSLRPHANERNPERRLRVGYVSADFRDHASRYFLDPLFRCHDPAQVEVFAYAEVARPDTYTTRFQSLCQGWRNSVALSDDALAEQIRRDGIDILVDLKLHTENNRLLVFAQKPAPVQATWLGYPGSTGLSTIDYRLSDPYLDPPGADESVYSERTLRLPDTFWCFDPMEARDIPVHSLPALETGIVTFGCLNNFRKVNDALLALWARVLGQVDKSRLLLMTPEGASRQRITDLFSREGIHPERLQFVARLPRLEHLAHYHQIDLALDTLPYNGHTTSLDALWMGVPVVTLVGKTVVGRAGYSQLMNLNLPELITTTPDAYIATVTALARDLPRLAQLRANLRPRMQQSPLMDAPAFARAFEAALRQMWRT
jgi:protein O-GlcNAc transferase